MPSVSSPKPMGGMEARRIWIQLSEYCNVVQWLHLFGYALLYKFQFLNEMVSMSHKSWTHSWLWVTSHGLIVDSIHMSEVVCVLCAVKVNDKASTVDLRGQTSFPVELSCRLSLQSVTAMMHVWFPYLHKLKGKSPWRQKRKTSSKILEMTVNQRNLCLYP